MRLSIALMLPLISSSCVSTEIPDWYKRDIRNHLTAANAVILYRVDSVSLLSRTHHHFMYRVDTTTIEVLKGAPPRGECYWIQSESELDTSADLGKKRLVILGREFESECGQIEPLYGAPGTVEYLEFFREVLAVGA